MLILKPCCIGDVLMATPLAAALAAAWPNAHLAWAIDRHSRPVLVGNPHVDELIEASGCVRGNLRLDALVRTALRLRRGRYDLVVVPDRSPILALLARATGARTRVGLDAAGRGRPYNVRVPAFAADPRSESAIYLDLVRAIGVQPMVERPIFVPTAADEQHAADALERVGIGPWGYREVEDSGGGGAARRRFVVMHPGGGANPALNMPSKRWPPQRFSSIAAWLMGHGLDVLLIAGPGEEALSAETCAAASAIASETRGKVADLGSRLSLGAVAAGTAEAALFIGNDSGTAHLAMAVCTPVVVIFGPTSPTRYGPPPGAGLAVAPDAAAVAGPLRGSTGPSIESVSVDDVKEAVRAMLSGMALDG